MLMCDLLINLSQSQLTCPWRACCTTCAGCSSRLVSPSTCSSRTEPCVVDPTCGTSTTFSTTCRGREGDTTGCHRVSQGACACIHYKDNGNVWRRIATTHSLTTHCPLTTHYPLTTHSDDTCPDDALPPDDALWRRIPWRRISPWRCIVATHSLTTHFPLTTHYPLTTHCDDTFPDDALPTDDALPPDDAFWRHMPWRRISPWRRIVATHSLTTHCPLATHYIHPDDELCIAWRHMPVDRLGMTSKGAGVL